ncbi:MAG: hypothetical protein JSU81_05665 [Candidatus Coatesbacteria bacterium]|nr:MAG: hypothetical protein JSU81_05665 [Candidatus Coatesbacteria bacterium]
MRKVVAVGAVVILACAALAYAMDPQPSPGSRVVSVKLTADQVKAVKAGAGKNVTITLSKAQLGDAAKTVEGTAFKLTLNTSHLRTNDVVVVSMEVSADRVSMNPQPSP